MLTHEIGGVIDGNILTQLYVLGPEPRPKHFYFSPVALLQYVAAATILFYINL